MCVCDELGKSLYDIKDWSLQDILDWVAFYRLKAKAEADAIRRAKGQSPRSSGTEVIVD